jgi:uncharacterized membrane protein YhaH (DUF805 family)
LHRPARLDNGSVLAAALEDPCAEPGIGPNLLADLKMSILRELFWRGRLRRSGFWLRLSIAIPLGLFLSIAADDLLGRPWDLLIVVPFFAYLLSVWARRLHDRGHSAWWLAWAAVPVFGPLLLIAECGLRRSEASAERFGPLPGRRAEYLTVENAESAR